MKSTERITDIEQTSFGISCTTEQGRLAVEFISGGIVRVRYSREDAFSGLDTGICVEQKPFSGTVSMDDGPDRIVLKANAVHAVIDKDSSAVSFLTPDGASLMTENSTNPRTAETQIVYETTVNKDEAKVIKSIDGDRVKGGLVKTGEGREFWKIRHNLEFQNHEGIYGLGGHEENILNLRGTMQYCYQHNMKEFVPVIVSSRGYGILYNSGSSMVFHDDTEGTFMQLDTVKELDYYFLNGPSLDDVIANYRTLTGAAPMLPRWAFGYCQSKERYETQDELVSVVKEYRDRKLPLDLIIQDWQYWLGDAWGSMEWDEERFPDPEKMCRDIHDMNAHVMISIWPRVRNCKLADELMEKGFMGKDGITYNALDEKARDCYWAPANRNIFSKGMDAWWCDCTEPAEADWNHENMDFSMSARRYEINTDALSHLLGAERCNLYSLFHSKGIYENQRKVTDSKRVVNLTRSSYAGQQRYSTIVWSGDIAANWDVFASQVSQGQNFTATGVPYWTNDIGAFFTRNDPIWFVNGLYKKGCEDLGYREFYTRWFQYGAFLPMFRSHGTHTPREVWRFGEPGEMFYESLKKTLELRYRLLPYIYSLAGMVTHRHYTIMRTLAFDFPNDPKALDVKDQYMFGPAFLVCPVLKPMYYEADSKELHGVEKNREVYLPAGTAWYDFHTGTRYDGGQTITADAPIDRMPIFVRAGSIVPMGPVEQYSGEKPDAGWDILVYPGADGTFTVYEDAGDTYDYEKGEFCMWHMTWNDEQQDLHISPRKGTFPGLVTDRTLNILIQE